MRFPPKSYNKDLESAEVSCFLLWVEAGVSGKPGRVGLGADHEPPAGPQPPAPGPHPQERREREQQDLEFAKEMAEDDDDSFP